MTGVFSSWKTFFPRFSVSEVAQDVAVPDLVECSESSHEDDAQRRKEVVLHEQYETKVDEDVKVFMEIAHKMSLSSLVFILQNHVQTQNFPESYLKVAAAAEAAAVVAPKRPLPKRKQFRFAQVTGGKVRTVVHEIPRAKDKSLWWDHTSTKDIRTECLNTVRYFRKYRPDFAANIVALAESFDSDEDDKKELEDIIKLLAHDATARGLEVHIVELLRHLKNDTLHAVLDAQREAAAAAAVAGSDNNTDKEECIRKASQQASLPARTLAELMGQGDRVEALKASLSRWRRQAKIGAEAWWD